VLRLAQRKPAQPWGNGRYAAGSAVDLSSVKLSEKLTQSSLTALQKDLSMAKVFVKWLLLLLGNTGDRLRRILRSRQNKSFTVRLGRRVAIRQARQKKPAGHWTD
jgi:hypothetical protein